MHHYYFTMAVFNKGLSYTVLLCILLSSAVGESPQGKYQNQLKILECFPIGIS